MEKALKKKLMICFISFTIIILISSVYVFRNLRSTFNDFQVKSGSYFFKESYEAINKEKITKWDIGISKENIKRDIIENEENRSELNSFCETVINISKKKRNIYFLFIYDLLVITVLIITRHEKEKYDDGFLKGMISMLAIFVTYKLLLSIFDLGDLLREVERVYREIVYISF